MNTVSRFLSSVLDLLLLLLLHKSTKMSKTYFIQFSFVNITLMNWIIRTQLLDETSKKNKWSFFARFDLPISLCTVCIKNHLKLNNWAILVFAFCHHISFVPHSLIYCDTMALLLSMYFISVNVFTTCSAYTSCHSAENTRTHTRLHIILCMQYLYLHNV